LKILTKNLRFFFKNDPLQEIFQNSVPKELTISPIYVLCANFVKFGRREVGEIARCLPDKKQNFPSLSRFCADRAQNLPRPAADDVLRVPQISPKWLSYSRMREHR